MQKSKITMNWPDDEDGDVLRSLEEDGFDFNKEYLVDFDVDFNKWPLSTNEEQEIKNYTQTVGFMILLKKILKTATPLVM